MIVQCRINRFYNIILLIKHHCWDENSVTPYLLRPNTTIHNSLCSINLGILRSNSDSIRGANFVAESMNLPLPLQLWFDLQCCFISLIKCFSTAFLIPCISHRNLKIHLSMYTVLTANLLFISTTVLSNVAMLFYDIFQLLALQRCILFSIIFSILSTLAQFEHFFLHIRFNPRGFIFVLINQSSTTLNFLFVSASH